MEDLDKCSAPFFLQDVLEIQCQITLQAILSSPLSNQPLLSLIPPSQQNPRRNNKNNSHNLQPSRNPIPHHIPRSLRFRIQLSTNQPTTIANTTEKG